MDEAFLQALEQGMPPTARRRARDRPPGDDADRREDPARGRALPGDAGLMGRAFALAAVAIAVVALAPDPALARFTVARRRSTLTGRPGRAASGTFEVMLKGERGRDFEIQIQDAIQQPDGSTTFAAPINSPFSASSWVSVTPGRFAGEPDRTQPVQFTVRVPRRRRRATTSPRSP